MVVCPACNKEFVPVEYCKYKSFVLVTCPLCDLMFCLPFKHPGRIWYESQRLYILREIGLEKLHWNHILFLRYLEKSLFAKGSILDIGCGNGHFLVEAQKRGYDPHGLDVDEFAVRAAKETNSLHNVFCGSLEDYISRFPENKFDIVTFFEVLEHLDNPSIFINNITKILKPGGFIALSVPNRDGWCNFIINDWDSPPHHLTKWNKPSLTSFIKNNSFDIIDFKIGWFGVDEVMGNIFKFGMIQRLLTSDNIQLTNTRDKIVRTNSAVILARVKRFITKVFSLPIELFLGVVNAQGISLYLVAKMK